MSVGIRQQFWASVEQFWTFWTRERGMVCRYGIDIVWDSGGGFCRFLILVEGQQVAELHLASRDKIQFISYHTSLRSPAVQRLNARSLFKTVLELPLYLRGVWIKPWVLNDYVYSITCLIWGGHLEAQSSCKVVLAALPPGHRLPETCLAWQHNLSMAQLEDQQLSGMPLVSLVTRCKHSRENIDGLLVTRCSIPAIWVVKNMVGFLFCFPPRMNHLKLPLGIQQQVDILHGILI